MTVDREKDPSAPATAEEKRLAYLGALRRERAHVEQGTPDDKARLTAIDAEIAANGRPEGAETPEDGAPAAETPDADRPPVVETPEDGRPARSTRSRK